MPRKTSKTSTTRKRKGKGRKEDVGAVMKELLPEIPAERVAEFEEIIPRRFNFRSQDRKWRREDEFRAYHQNPKNIGLGFPFTAEQVVRYYADGFRNSEVRPDGLEKTLPGTTKEWFMLLPGGGWGNHPHEREGPFSANEIGDSIFTNTKLVDRSIAEKDWRSQTLSAYLRGEGRMVDLADGSRPRTTLGFRPAGALQALRTERDRFEREWLRGGKKKKTRKRKGGIKNDDTKTIHDAIQQITSNSPFGCVGEPLELKNPLIHPNREPPPEEIRTIVIRRPEDATSGIGVNRSNDGRPASNNPFICGDFLYVNGINIGQIPYEGGFGLDEDGDLQIHYFPNRSSFSGSFPRSNWAENHPAGSPVYVDNHDRRAQIRTRSLEGGKKNKTRKRKGGGRKEDVAAVMQEWQPVEGKPPLPIPPAENIAGHVEAMEEKKRFNFGMYDRKFKKHGDGLLSRGLSDAKSIADLHHTPHEKDVKDWFLENGGQSEGPFSPKEIGNAVFKDTEGKSLFEFLYYHPSRAWARRGGRRKTKKTRKTKKHKTQKRN